MKIFVASIFLLALLPFGVSAQEDTAEVTVYQQLYSVEPTLDVDDLERYSQGGILSDEFFRLGLPVAILGLLVFLGFIAVGRKKRLKCSKKECRQTYIRYITIGVLNAFALFVILELIGGVLRPTTLQNLAVYVDDAQRFAPGDKVRVTFDISNSGGVLASGIEFRNDYSSELRLDPESVLLTKDGSLPASYLPYVTSSQILVDVGELAPGESTTISYDFLIVNGTDDEIENVATVTGENILVIDSNTIHIRRTVELKN